MGHELAGGFRARARLEADRYGPDPWIFVRELLQNARDAGATQVKFVVEQTTSGDRVVCQDNGEGMDLDHARRYLFSLYASSKETRSDQVGKFGVGFWSILRFEPTRIVIGSAPSGGEPWQVALKGSLSQAVLGTPTIEAGTEVTLERPSGDGHLARRIHDAAHQNARFLCTRNDPTQPLLITINGETINEPFALPAPSASFSRGRVRGVVGLGTAARVELFSRGLRVRSASSLSEFLSAGGRHTDRSRVQFTELPGRLAPQALLESDSLELLLSRSDAREDRTLRRLVTLARRELDRLITRQIDAARPLPLLSRLVVGVANALRTSLVWRLVTASLIGAALASAIAYWLWHDQVLVRMGLQNPEVNPVVVATSGGPEVAPPSSPNYHDLANSYQGPQVDILDSQGVAVDLSYTPADQVYRFAALMIKNFDARGTPQLAAVTRSLPDYVGTPCTKERACTHVALEIDAASGPMRIPVPTGHRLDVAQLSLGPDLGDPPEKFHVLATSLDEPVLWLDQPTRATLRYVTVPAPSREKPTIYAPKAELPPELKTLAEGLRSEPVATRVELLTHEVATRVRYSISPSVARQHGTARDRGLSFYQRALVIGAGDCDVQNGLLVALLQHARVPARLAVGYVGRDGVPARWLHAWVEYRIETGPWKHADASKGALFEVGEPGDTDAEVASATPDTGDFPRESEPQPGQPNHTGAIQSPLPTVTTQAEASATTPTQLPPSEGPKPAVVGPLPGWLPPAAVGLGLFGLLLVVGGRRTRRRTSLDEGGDLSKLLQGALQQPDAFRSLPALYRRPLVPLLGGRQISLERALGLAAGSALFQTRKAPGLAEDASSRNVAVLDGQSPEGRTVADTLGAVDLDMWDRLLTTSSSTPLLADVNAALARAGERWTVLVNDGLGTTLKSLDLGPLRLRKSPMRGTRVIVLDRQNPLLLEAAAVHRKAPQLAVLRLLDMLTARLDLAAPRRAELLSVCAQSAIREGS